MSAATNPVARPIKGAAYRVKAPGATLTKPVSRGYCAWGYESISLPAGALIVFEGARKGPGSDTVPEDTFTYDPSLRGLPGEEFTGAFSPSFWGSANMDLLELHSEGPL